MTRLELKQGDLTKEVADALVNAANSGLMGGGGVDGAIHRAGGPAILEECREIRARQGELPTGQAVATTAGRLRARWVIHTVGPVWRGGGEGEPELLRQAHWNSLALAARLGARTVAFPAISTGVYGYPIEQAARVALEAARSFARQHPEALEEIRFVLFTPHDLEVFRAADEGLTG
jgi:O-acetyl-ADP-ribose deacetylase (regulator of RNase III)